MKPVGTEQSVQEGGGHRPASRMVAVSIASLLFIGSILWCIATWNSPGRFIFLPGGDVGLGFRSHAGWLQWIEYAPWSADPDYVQWALPWLPVLGIEVAAVIFCLLRLRSGRRG